MTPWGNLFSNILMKESSLQLIIKALPIKKKRKSSRNFICVFNVSSSLSRFTHFERYALNSVFFGFWFHTLSLLGLLRLTRHPSTASCCFPVFAFRVSRIDPSVYIHWLVCLGLLFTCSIRCEASLHSVGQSTCEEGTAHKIDFSMAGISF